MWPFQLLARDGYEQYSVLDGGNLKGTRVDVAVKRLGTIVRAQWVRHDLRGRRCTAGGGP